MSGAAARRATGLLAEAENKGELAVVEAAADRRLFERWLADDDADKARSRTLFSPLPGIYVRAAYWRELNPSERHLALLRSVLRRHACWAASHVSAALLWGLPVSWNLVGKLHVETSSTLPEGYERGVVRHRLSKDEIGWLEDLQVTSLLRTLFDCLVTLPFRDALAIADGYLRMTGESREELLSKMASRYSGRRGVRRVLAICGYADGRAESGGESIARAAMIELGFEVPDLQVEFSDPVDSDRSYRADFVWHLDDGRMILGELDGMEKYQLDGNVVEVFANERKRESRLTATGCSVVRFGFGDVDGSSDARLSKLLEAYGVPRGRRPRLVSGVPVA